jgi:3-hydroxyisobutyrate dehydrogenase-like beta-hydroxyacid dehydrogenase
MNKRVGFIGLGIMGGAMAKNLMEAGYRLIVRDLVEDRVRNLVELGATQGKSPNGIARNSDVIITMLMNSSTLIFYTFQLL